MVKQVDIPSPNFPLICSYETSKLWHVDLYHLEPQEVPALELEEHWREGITMIEWPERLPLLPPYPLWITLALAPLEALSLNSFWSQGIIMWPI